MVGPKGYYEVGGLFPASEVQSPPTSEKNDLLCWAEAWVSGEELAAPAPQIQAPGVFVGPSDGQDISPDMGQDIGPDIGPDMGADMGADIGPDMGPDMGPIWVPIWVPILMLLHLLL